ncbi:hypothetical protein [Arthrobacter bambusae]|nr:hypothetical protein [Arthrobacter bambusae]MDQ0127269.1 hypothetical protein [Arthrobacter bambusae]
MPTYMLEGTSEVRLDIRPLSLSLRVAGSSAQAWLEVTQNGQPIDSVVRPPNMVILPRIGQPTLVSIVPLGADRFPSPTTIHLDIAIEDKSSVDPQRAVLTPIDVSGLDRKALISLETVGGKISLKVARTQTDANLGELANAARVTCREILGAQWVPDDMALDMTLALDGSASTGNLVTDGTVNALASILTGISQVVSNGNMVRAAIVGDAFTPLPPTDLDLIPQALEEAYKAQIPSTGFRAAASGHASGASREVTYLITGSLPADIADLEKTNIIGPKLRHLVVAASPSAFALLGETSMWHTVVAPGDVSQSLKHRLLGDPAALHAAVLGLLQGCFEQGSELYAKAGR